MKIPNFRRLFKSDYPDEYQGLVEKLSVSLNYGLEVLYEALNNRLTFADNFASTVVQVAVRVDASGIPINNTTFRLSTSNQTVSGLWVISVLNQDNAIDYPPAAVMVVGFTTSANSVTINNIKGLKANTNYLLRIVTV